MAAATKPPMTFHTNGIGITARVTSETGAAGHGQTETMSSAAGIELCKLLLLGTASKRGGNIAEHHALQLRKSLVVNQPKVIPRLNKQIRQNP